MASDLADEPAGRGHSSFPEALPPKGPIQSTPRMIGVDLARFVAIVGMMAAHLLASKPGPEWVHTLTSGFPSVLFAVLGGFGSYFVCRRYLEAGQKRAAVAALLARGAVVALLGIVMEMLPDHRIAVILVYFGAAIMASAGLVLLSQRGLATVLVVLAFTAPLVLQVVRGAQLPVRLGYLDYSRPDLFFLSVLVTGTYPVVTWIVYLGVGLFLARPLVGGPTASARRKTAWLAVGLGVGSAVVAWATGRAWLGVASKRLAGSQGLGVEEAKAWLTASGHGGPPQESLGFLFALAPHSGSVVDMVLSSGVAIALIGSLVLATRKLQSPPLLLAPFTTAGATPLTIYVGHVALTAWFYSWASVIAGTTFGVVNPGVDPWWIIHDFALQLSLALLFSTLLYVTKKKGPLEWLTSKVARAAAKSQLSN